MEELYRWFIEQHHGAHTYAELQRQAIQLAREDATNTALFILIAGVAGHVHRQLEGMPLDVDVARRIHNEMTLHLKHSEQAVQKKREALVVLNTLARAQLGRIKDSMQ